MKKLLLLSLIVIWGGARISAQIDVAKLLEANEDENGQVWLAYNDPVYMAKRHNINDCEKPVQKVSNALANFSKAATE